jgi:hypothetical protein
MRYNYNTISGKTSLGVSITLEVQPQVCELITLKDRLGPKKGWQKVRKVLKSPV